MTCKASSQTSHMLRYVVIQNLLPVIIYVYPAGSLPTRAFIAVLSNEWDASQVVQLLRRKPDVFEANLSRARRIVELLAAAGLTSEETWELVERHPAVLKQRYSTATLLAIYYSACFAMHHAVSCTGYSAAMTRCLAPSGSESTSLLSATLHYRCTQCCRSSACLAYTAHFSHCPS